MNLAKKTGEVVTVPKLEDGVQFFDEFGGSGKKLLDPTLAHPGDPHGAVTHMVQDLMIDKALARAGEKVTASEFRQLLGRLQEQSRELSPGEMVHTGDKLWRAIYDAIGEAGALNEPETLSAVLRERLPELQ